MSRVKPSIFVSVSLVLALGLLLTAAPAEARRPWGGALERILVQGRMSDAERDRLRRDMTNPRRDWRNSRDARDSSRMTREQRDALRRDLRDANRQLDRGGDRSRSRNGNGRNGRRDKR